MVGWKISGDIPGMSSALSSFRFDSIHEMKDDDSFRFCPSSFLGIFPLISPLTAPQGGFMSILILRNKVLIALLALAALFVAGCSDLPGIPAPGAAGVIIDPPVGSEPLETTESGGTASFKVSLLRQPGEEVKLQVGGGAGFAVAP
ncbi:MAG: hypothetical protein LBM75_08245, partial [Myxococcales bacterium]|nr:hypothetical protein [Myxococcales bacterium]